MLCLPQRSPHKAYYVETLNTDFMKIRLQTKIILDHLLRLQKLRRYTKLITLPFKPIQKSRMCKLWAFISHSATDMIEINNTYIFMFQCYDNVKVNNQRDVTLITGINPTAKMILHDINDKMKLLHTLRKYFLDSFILYPPLYHQINVRVSVYLKMALNTVSHACSKNSLKLFFVLS